MELDTLIKKEVNITVKMQDELLKTVKNFIIKNGVDKSIEPLEKEIRKKLKPLAQKSISLGVEWMNG